MKPFSCVSPSLPCVSPPAAEDWWVMPSQNAGKSRTAYGLATTNAPTAAAPAMPSPRSAGRSPPIAAPCAAAAPMSGSSTIPAVYFVAHASPSPMPATT
jgi:hypothetical protein